MEKREDLFYEILTYLQAMQDLESEFKIMLEKSNLDVEFHRNSFVDMKLVDFLLRALEKMFLDSERWIRYWITELDFGRKWEPGTVTDSDGTDVKLQTAQQLHAFLLKKLVYKSRISLEEADRRLEERGLF